MKAIFLIMGFCSMLIFSLSASSQDAAAKYAGMWSDPPDTPEGLFCFFTCSDYGLDVLTMRQLQHVTHLFRDDDLEFWR